MPVLCLVGPTAVGKTALALELARDYDAEIVSVDSMQVYRGMDIGTAKATPAERSLAAHHLIDIVDPDEDYSVARFINDAAAALADLRQRGKNALLVGGTGLYFKGLLEGLFEVAANDQGAVREKLAARLAAEGREALHRELQAIDPESARRIHPHDTHRLLRALEIYLLTGIPWSRHLQEQQQEPLLRRALVIGLACERPLLYERINRRVEMMLTQGLQAEVAGLLAAGYGPELPAMQAIGYRHLVNFIHGRWDWEETVELLARDTRHYAKRQFTWFNRLPGIHWLEPAAGGAIRRLIEAHLQA